MKRFIVFAIALMMVQLGKAAEKVEPKMNWFNPHNEKEIVVHGQGWSEKLRGKFWRFPERAQQLQRAKVWGLSKQSAGVYLRFKTGADEVKVRYTPSRVAMDHFPATGFSGMDLYARNSGGEWRYCGGRRNTKISNKDTVIYTFKVCTPQGWRDDKTEFYLYLPLYAETYWCEVGVKEGNGFSFIPKGDEKPVAAFGTSILQGGCASRPGMAWTNITSRNIDRTVLNFGFSAAGNFEPSVVKLVSEIDAALFLFACLPNMNGLTEERVRLHVLGGVKILREKSEAPILLCEQTSGHPIFAGINKNAESKNALLRQLYNELVDLGVKDIYYLTAEEINMPLEGVVDGIHPNDLGMKVIGDAVAAKIKTIIK